MGWCPTIQQAVLKASARPSRTQSFRELARIQTKAILDGKAPKLELAISFQTDTFNFNIDV